VPSTCSCGWNFAKTCGFIGGFSNESRSCFSLDIFLKILRVRGHATLGEKGGLHQVVSKHDFFYFF
jgi:hypothetical protein